MTALPQATDGLCSPPNPILLDGLRANQTLIGRCRSSAIDADRLQKTLESAFRRPVPRPTGDPNYSIFLAGDYLGVAMVASTPHGAYLAKLAVRHDAQGGGLAARLWGAVIRAHPQLFWRSRADNPVCHWYARLAEGSARSGPWSVFWRGLPQTAIPAATEYASSRLRDSE